MVYLMLIRSRQLCRIEYAESLEVVLEGIKTSSVKDVDLIGKITGEANLEKELRKRFSDLHIKGKWFKFDRRIYYYFYPNVNNGSYYGDLSDQLNDETFAIYSSNKNEYESQ